MYEAPRVHDLGSVADLTEDLNKIGHSPDMYSNIVPIVGSIVTAR